MYEFRVEKNPEPDQASEMYFVEVYDGDERIEAFATDDPQREYSAWAETQEMSYEERYAPFGPAWEAEREARV